MRRVALVTGASRGIGAAVARRLAADGCDVAIGYCRAEEAALALAAELSAAGCRAEVFRADVASTAEVRDMIDKVLQKYYQIDILVCSAGVAWQGLFGETTEEIWRHIFAVNADGTYRCCRAVLPGMLHRKSGRIVTVSSIWGLAGASCEVAYSASKAAVVGLTKALAKELGPSGITVNCVAPGVIDTDMNAALSKADREALKEETPLGRLGTPGEVAEAVCFLASERASFITGQILSPNGGFLT